MNRAPRYRAVNVGGCVEATIVDRDGGNVKVLFTTARKFSQNRDLSGILHRLPAETRSVIMAARLPRISWLIILRSCSSRRCACQ